MKEKLWGMLNKMFDMTFYLFLMEFAFLFLILMDAKTEILLYRKWWA